jgi:hypothetical protein
VQLHPRPRPFEFAALEHRKRLSARDTEATRHPIRTNAKVYQRNQHGNAVAKRG